MVIFYNLHYISLLSRNVVTTCPPLSLTRKLPSFTLHFWRESASQSYNIPLASGYRTKLVQICIPAMSLHVVTWTPKSAFTAVIHIYILTDSHYLLASSHRDTKVLGRKHGEQLVKTELHFYNKRPEFLYIIPHHKLGYWFRCYKYLKSWLVVAILNFSKIICTFPDGG